MSELFCLSPHQPIPSTFPPGMVLLIDKPLGWTSFDVVNKVRYELAKRMGVSYKKLKVGHAGTLDPLATGLLVICVGVYTKQIESLQAISKTYTGVITFGATTPSFDLEKAIDKTFPTAHLSDTVLQETLPQFRGIIQQAPPVFSAIKIDGKRVYKDARTGDFVEMPERPVRIESFEIGPLRPVDPAAQGPVTLISKKGAQIYLHPDYPQGLQVDFEVTCGKGAYIRSLANDLGQAVDSGAYLSRLCRTHASGFSLSEAWQMDDFVRRLSGQTAQ